MAAIVTLWAVRAFAKPADHDHPCGHGKIENFSALFETGLLLATCAWIYYEAVNRLASGVSHVEVIPWAFGIFGALDHRGRFPLQGPGPNGGEAP